MKGKTCNSGGDNRRHKFDRNKNYFQPDPEIFEVTEFDFEVLLTRLRELAFLNKGLKSY